MKIYVSKSFSNGTGDIDYVGYIGTNRKKALAKAKYMWNHYTASEKKAGAYVLVGTATLDIDKSATPREIEEAYNELLWNTNDNLNESMIYYRDSNGEFKEIMNEEMIDKKTLEKTLIDFDMRARDLAEYLGISYAAARNKINGASEFKHSEIYSLIKLWGKDKVDEIFLWRTKT